MPDLSKLSRYLKSEMVKDGDLIKFVDAGEIIIKDNKWKPGEKKASLEITIALADGNEKTVSLNSTSYNELTKVLGMNSDTWVGKVAKIQKIKQNVSGKIKDVVYIVPVETVINVNKE